MPWWERRQTGKQRGVVGQSASVVGLIEVHAAGANML